MCGIVFGGVRWNAGGLFSRQSVDLGISRKVWLRWTSVPVLRLVFFYMYHIMSLGIIGCDLTAAISTMATLSLYARG